MKQLCFCRTSSLCRYLQSFPFTFDKQLKRVPNIRRTLLIVLKILHTNHIYSPLNVYLRQQVTLLKICLEVLRCATGAARAFKPDKTPITQLPPCSILQNPGKTTVLLVLPPMAPLKVYINSDREKQQFYVCLRF